MMSADAPASSSMVGSQGVSDFLLRAARPNGRRSGSLQKRSVGALRNTGRGHASVEQGKPYDQLVRELISASGKANSNPAVGYILGDDVDPMELAAATSQIFLGVRIGCAMYWLSQV